MRGFRFKIELFFLLLTFFIPKAHGQWTDYGVWSSVSSSTEITEKLGFKLNLQARWDYNATRLGKTFINLGFNRKISPGWKIRSTLRLGTSRSTVFLWEPLRRLSASARWKAKLNDEWEFSARWQYQTSSKGRLETTIRNSDFSDVIRFRPAIHYRISKKIQSTIFVELFAKHTDFGWYYSSFRARATVSFKISKKRRASLSYQFEQEKYTPDPWAEHTLIYSLDWGFKRRKTIK